MTGIMGSEDETIQEQQQQQHEAVHLQQPRLETKTLKKGEVKIFFVKLTCNFFGNYTETKSNINMVVYVLVPGDSSWVVLDSNGSSNNSKEGEDNFFFREII